MPLLETSRLSLRNWQEIDRDLFHEINADRKVMEFFPFRRTRAESDLLFDKVRSMIGETGYGFHAVALKDSGEAIGFCGLAQLHLEPLFPHGTVEIGWRLATRFWGNGYISEAAAALIDHGLSAMGLDEIIAFAVAANTRSTAVMARIGMTHDPARDFDHPRVPDTHPELRHHLLFSIRKHEWRRHQA